MAGQSGLGLLRKQRGSLHYSSLLSSLAPNAQSGLGLLQKHRGSLHYSFGVSLVSPQMPILVWAFCKNTGGPCDTVSLAPKADSGLGLLQSPTPLKKRDHYAIGLAWQCSCT